MDIVNELGLAVDKNDEEDLKELGKMLHEILNYPLSDIANTHSEAMRLGNFDLE
jgi:hypothetical protein